MSVVLVSVLDADEEINSKKVIFNIVELEKSNHATIDRAVNFNKNQIMIFLTDDAPYMVKSAKTLKVFYTKMIHVTCVAHAMHRIAEEIR